VNSRRLFTAPHHPNLSIAAQCALIGLSRSSDYHVPNGTESEQNLKYMRLIDEQSLRTPFYGSRRMTRRLVSQGHAVNRKRVQCLLRTMGIQGTVPGPHTSRPTRLTRSIPTYFRTLSYQAPTSCGPPTSPVHSDGNRLHVLGGHHRLVQSLCDCLGTVEYLRSVVVIFEVIE